MKLQERIAQAAIQAERLAWERALQEGLPAEYWPAVRAALGPFPQVDLCRHDGAHGRALASWCSAALLTCPEAYLAVLQPKLRAQVGAPVEGPDNPAVARLIVTRLLREAAQEVPA